MSDYGADSNPDLDQAYLLLVANGFMPEQRSNVMQWTYDGYRVQKLANKKGKSNLLLKFELE